MHPFLNRILERTFRLIMLMASVLVTGCASTSITSDDLANTSASSVPASHRFNGTVNVQFLVVLTIPEPDPWDQHPYINRFMLKEAVEKAIVKNSQFTQVVQGNADYILDVWVFRQKLKVPPFGFGEFAAEVSSFWRLTRVSDGKMFGRSVNGLGRINSGMGPSTRSMISALQNMIQNGLTDLSDQPAAQLAVQSAEHLRPHIEPWVNNVRQNWSRLRAGLTLEEVEKIIGPVRTSGAVQEMLSDTTKFESDGRTFRLSGTNTYRYRSGIFTLVFRNDDTVASIDNFRLAGWKLY
ncbi:MAG: hypothetical protein HZB47_13870 [Nitrosomonadales bacterium]|nr:hypothetical protein [Nitrosomonadales bacterium]